MLVGLQRNGYADDVGIENEVTISTVMSSIRAQLKTASLIFVPDPSHFKQRARYFRPHRGFVVD